LFMYFCGHQNATQMINNNFINRHLGPSQDEVERMLQTIGVASLDELINRTIPSSIRLNGEMNLPEGMSEYEYLRKLRLIAAKNKLFRSYIGMGYYNTITPPVIQRNILENPGWYTAYTPYQAEISQGRLEALLAFQTMVIDMTGMEIANASLLDEGSAAGEAMIMAFNSRSRASVKSGANKFFVDSAIFPQTLDVLITRAEPLGIEVVVGKYNEIGLNESFFGTLVQYPDERGEIRDYRAFTALAHEAGQLVCVACDLMSLALLTAPGEWGADIVFGSTQRFGVPMGFGGPHAAFFATREEFKRNMPGRIIGVSVDAMGRRALRMALQTREQHIKRERATSNICTSQVLLAVMAAMYAAYHGPDGIREIASDINHQTGQLAKTAEQLGYRIISKHYFDTLEIELPTGLCTGDVRSKALGAGINFRYFDEESRIGISLDETVSASDLKDICTVLAEAAGKTVSMVAEAAGKSLHPDFIRNSAYLTHEVFNSYHSETQMMRFLKTLENRDLALNRSMIPLGSCTMKLNAATELFPITWPEFNSLHPFIPADQALGYQEMIRDLENDLAQITGFDAVSLQPNSGATGEYAGLLVIRAWHLSRGDAARDVCLIPSSAHGTNPASSVMAGMKVVVVKCDEMGNIDIDDLRAKAEANAEKLAALMITYPSTHGVFEEGILEVIRIVHSFGGQVYMDGANMNAQVGLTNPGLIGADVCHLNLHKTFAIPHGGGGPGVGPIGVARHLTPFLPGHSQMKVGGEQAIRAVASAPFGSASILPISYAYIKLLGAKGLSEATRYAILNANYLKTRLEGHYPILYTGKNGFVAHEMILDCNPFHRSAGVEVIDIAKRLMDYGFHAPTVAFPVHGTLMVEPTESEPLSELDRFADAMISIRQEIAELEEGKADPAKNLLKNAPHTLEMAMVEDWAMPYSRQQAAFPMTMSLADKYWPSVTRVDDAYGDRNLVCSCEPISAYTQG
jgi:glycine dehydrogenase